jgi:hypothetical protein
MEAMMRSLLIVMVLVGRAAAEPDVTQSRVAGEVNVLWPLIGISEFKAIVPLGDHRGELVAGIYADYAQIVRPNAGKVTLIAAIAGWRQFLYRGLHLELTATIGIRHELDHPGDGMTLNEGYIRAWPMVGYELALSPRMYVNARAGAGVLVYRETHWSEETKVVPGVDVNFGVWF